MVFLLIFLFFQLSLFSVKEIRENIIGRMFLGSPVENMTINKYKFLKNLSTCSVIAVLPLAYSLFLHRKSSKNNLFKNKLFLGSSLCCILSLGLKKKMYDINQYLENGLSVFCIINTNLVEDKNISLEDNIKTYVTNSKLEQLFVFYNGNHGGLLKIPEEQAKKAKTFFKVKKGVNIDEKLKEILEKNPK